MKILDLPTEFKKIRSSLGLTQAQLAVMLGHENRQKIADYETRRRRIVAEDWVKIKTLEAKRGA